MTISFTQFLRPRGERRRQEIDRPYGIEAKAAALVAAGFVFEIEELTNGKIHMDVSRPEDDEPIELELCENGPPVLDAVDRMVTRAFITWESGAWPPREEEEDDDDCAEDDED